MTPVAVGTERPDSALWWPGRGINVPRPGPPTLLSWWQVRLTTGSCCYGDVNVKPMVAPSHLLWSTRGFDIVIDAKPVKSVTPGATYPVSGTGVPLTVNQVDRH